MLPAVAVMLLSSTNEVSPRRLLAQIPDSTHRTASLGGVVLDTVGRAVPRANVLLPDQGLSTTSDDSGHFLLGDVVPGARSFRVLRIGFSPVAFDVTLTAGRTLLIEVHMRPVTILDTVTVTGESRLRRFGFYDRRRMGLGTFLTPDQVEALENVVTNPSRLLRDVRGIELHCVALVCIVKPRFAYCLQLFIDGVRTNAQMDDVLTTDQVYAVEVYDRPTSVPTEFTGQLPQKGGRGKNLSPQSGCGAVVVWTKSHSGG